MSRPNPPFLDDPAEQARAVYIYMRLNYDTGQQLLAAHERRNTLLLGILITLAVNTALMCAYLFKPA